MSSTVTKFSTALMSAAALAAMAVVPCAISIFMFAAMFGEHSVTDKNGRTVTVHGGGSPTMLLLAAFLGFIGFGLAIGCLYTLWWAFTQSGKKERQEEDQSWRDMPYPKG